MIIRIKKRVLLATLVVVAVWSAVTGYSAVNTLNPHETPYTRAYIALVIDDFGNNGDGTDEMLKLGIPITAAVMPFQPNSRSDAEAAHKAGLEIILHIPMEPVQGRQDWLGPKGITTALPHEEISQRVADGLEQIEWAVGMNNHMGSKATQNEAVMTSVLTVARQNGLYFVDSKTSQGSVVSEVAKTLGVTAFKRDVFLDNSKNQRDIEKQLLKLGDIALQKGYAVGIGHVGPEGGKPTARAIQNVYPQLQRQGIEFVFVSRLHALVEANRLVMR